MFAVHVQPVNFNFSPRYFAYTVFFIENEQLQPGFRVVFQNSEIRTTLLWVLD